MNFDLKACIDGDKAAWDAFVDTYGRVIYAAVRKVIGSSGPIDDPVQEVFVRLVRNDFRLLRTYDPERASLTTWLTLVARSAAIDFVRKRRLNAVPLADFDAPEKLEEAESGLPEIPYHLLSGRQRLVIRMLFDQSMSVTEAAQGTSEISAAISDVLSFKPEFEGGWTNGSVRINVQLVLGSSRKCEFTA